MPGFPKCIRTHKVHPINMALSFFSFSTSDLKVIEIKIKVNILTVMYQSKIFKIWGKQAQKYVPLIMKGGVGNGDHHDGPLNLKPDENNLVLSTSSSMHLVIEIG